MGEPAQVIRALCSKYEVSSAIEAHRQPLNGKAKTTELEKKTQRNSLLIGNGKMESVLIITPLL